MPRSASNSSPLAPIPTFGRPPHTRTRCARACTHSFSPQCAFYYGGDRQTVWGGCSHLQSYPRSSALSPRPSFPKEEDQGA